MSCLHSAALQQAVFARLSGDRQLSQLVDAHIHDAMPGGTLPPSLIVLGDERIHAHPGAAGTDLANHDLTIVVITRQPGFAAVKSMAATVCRVLLEAPLILGHGRVVGLWFRRARARRTGETRQIDILLRALVEGT